MNKKIVIIGITVLFILTGFSSLSSGELKIKTLDVQSPIVLDETSTIENYNDIPSSFHNTGNAVMV